METINHECYVSFEVAKLLKEAGFDWKCEYPYFNGVFDSDSYEPDNFLDTTYQIAAPTLDVAQRWLREVKEMYAEAYLSESHHTPVWIAEVYLWENRPLGRELRDKCLCTGIGPVYFDTYEEALEAAINKCLTILLEEKQ